ncbi:MAG: hypothetical protein M1410_04525 [Candidatus Thermoplasmatota archaeon]|nr:hypothetical protein [Candidatus Thermoplasmatota archaeon]
MPSLPFRKHASAFKRQSDNTAKTDGGTQYEEFMDLTQVSHSHAAHSVDPFIRIVQSSSSLDSLCSVRPLPQASISGWYDGTHLSVLMPASLASQRNSDLMEKIGLSDLYRKFSP